MAEIVLGIGTSHSPMLGQTAEQWFDSILGCGGIVFFPTEKQKERSSGGPCGS